MIDSILKTESPLSLGLAQASAPPVELDSTALRLAEEPDLFLRIQNVLAGRFDLLRLIGLGGMSSVYLARHRSHGALFAIKVLRKEFSADQGVVTRFRREALHAACLLGHPNIVSVLDVEEADGLQFLTMPYIRGEDLDGLLARTGAFPATEVLQAALQVNTALEFASRKDLLHGDLTPGNIRLSEWGFYLVLDFGLSRALGQRTGAAANQQIVGTPFYMAPEQLLGESPDIRTDLYSLGVILFELLTGTPPFTGRTFAALRQSHLEHTPVISAKLCAEHPDLTALIQRLLEKRRESRFQNPAELRAALLTCGARSEAAGLALDLTGQEEVRPPRRRLETLGQGVLPLEGV